MRKPILLLVAAAMLFSAVLLVTSASAAPAPPSVQAKVKAEIFRVFGAGSTGWCFQRIAWRESGYNPKAINWNDQHVNGPGSFGVLQLGRVVLLDKDIARLTGGSWKPLLDYRVNIRAAKILYGKLGIRPWRSC